jgi:hypothetical protein
MNNMEPNMKQIVLAALAAALGAVAAPASAQTVAGEVSVHGFVAPRCGATYAAAPSFQGMIELGELSQSNGTLSPALQGSSDTAPAGVASFLVGCTGGAAQITLSASRLANPAEPGNSNSSNDIDYTAEIRIALAAGGFATVDYTTAQPLPAPTVESIAHVFANVAGNFQVRVFGLNAENGPASILIAGDYDSTITITVAPPV